MMRRYLPLITLGMLAACDNPCQAFCTTLADYAADCGTPFSDAEIEACVDDWASATADDRKMCVDYGTPDRLRREWSCDDVNLYRDGGSNTSGSNATDTGSATAR